MSPFLKCHDLIKLYSDPVTNIKVAALRGIDLEVDAGGLVALIGPSGAGKSTLINIIGGIEKPSSGDVIIGDKVINKLKAKELNQYRRQDIGFVYHHSLSLTRMDAYTTIALQCGIALTSRAFLNRMEPERNT